MLNQFISDNLEKVRKSVLVFDIETSAFFPDGREISIKTNFEEYVSSAKVKWFGCYSFKYNNGFYLNAQTETQQIINLLNEHDVLVGFNSEEFDFPILKNNGFTNDFKKYIQVDIMQILGTSNARNKQGYAYKNRAALMDYKLKNNSLRGMAEVMELEHQKGDIDYHIFQKDEWTNEEVLEIKKYLYSDVMATKQMFDKLWNYWLPFAELLPEKSVYDLSWIKSSIASLTYKAACNILNVEPTYSEKPGTSEEMGGNVYLPKYEELNKVWYVDIGSLYPHMIVQANLPSEVIDPSDEDKKKLWHGNEVFQVKGYYDISKWHQLSEYIYSKLKQRIHLKETDKDNPMVYTLKIFLNGLYGIFRSPIFEKIHTPNIGWDTCYLGRQVQALIKEMLEQFGFEVVMGDTDSVFFIANEGTDNSKEYVLDCLSQITEIIKDNLPFPVDTFKINIEHYLDYLMVPFSEQPIIGEDGKNKKEKNKLIYERKGMKKNYLMIYKNKEESVVKLVGLPIIKENATALGIKIYEEVLKSEILKNNRAKFSKEFIKQQVDEYLKRPEALELISQEYKVNAASSYKLPGQIQAQISTGYFNGNEGVIRLIKNNKIGKAGKGQKYCTIQEAIDAKLTVEEIDLEKVFNELEPFVEYKEPEIDVVNVETKIEATVSKEEFEACKEVLEPIKKKRGRPKKTLDK
jgi:DNA polymerase elongation subunit (family B)